MKVAVVIPARNEEIKLPGTLEALLRQTYPLERIVVVNDGSTDKTSEVANSFERVTVIEKEDRGFDAVGKAILAETFNAGFDFIAKNEPEYTFVLVVGADTVLPPTYVKDLIDEFEKDPQLVMASGVYKEETKRIGEKVAIRGSGRLIRSNFWKEIGENYPVKVGWESYPVYKALSFGYHVKGFNHIMMDLTRPTGKRTDYFAYGEAMRALGYFWILAIGRILLKKSFKVSWPMLKGYIVGKDRYEKDLRTYVRRIQKRRIRRLILRF